MSESDTITAGEIEAAAKEAAPAEKTPTQQTQTTPDKPLASATDAPVVTEKPEDRFKGWIPPDAHKRVVDGFHSRLDALGWAHGLNREEVEEALALRRSMNERRASAANAEPQPDSKDQQTGELFYSPQQAAKWATWKAEQIVNAKMAEFEQRFSPIESTFTEHQRVAAVVGEIDAIAALPGADEFATDMANYVKDINDRRANGERLRKVTAVDAYLAVVPKKLAERSVASEADIRKKLMKDINDTTERVKDDVNPGRVAAASRKPDSAKSTKELLEEEFNRRAATA